MPKINFENMKKSFVLALLLGIITLGQAKPQISGISFPNSVGLFDLYEISFKMGNYANPYDPEVIDVYAEFTAPNGQVMKVNGFYYEGYRFEEHNGYEKAYAENNKGWRIRFTPDQVGTWRFLIHAKDKKGNVSLSSYNTLDFKFDCHPVESATGFISLANSMYLKREIVKGGKQQYHSFFPIGPNVAWYICKSYYNYATPKGIYEYERRIDSLSGNANYMRVWINRYPYLSLYGLEYTQLVNGEPTMYFDNTINQKDAAELDHILRYAAQHDISVMLCLFNYSEFKVYPEYDGKLERHPGDWRLNPFYTELGLKKTDDFFTDPEARRITKNLFRYVVARWGYATNLVAWEFWNEMDNMSYDKEAVNQYRNGTIEWHKEMADFIRSNDPFGHPVSTSLGNSGKEHDLYDRIFNSLDFVMEHNYYSIRKAKSKEQTSYQLYLSSSRTRDVYPDKPFFIGEFGFGNVNAETYLAKDPYGIDMHNVLWSTLFSGTMAPASFWDWNVIDKCGIHQAFKPVLTFCQDMPILSGSFTAHTTGLPSTKVKYRLDFPNNLATYYMINATEDTIYGWSQDTAFLYQSLRRLTDKVGSNNIFVDNGTFDPKGYVYSRNAKKKPKPSSKSNSITLPISKQSSGAQYLVKWYDGETGREIASERTYAMVAKDGKITIEFPSSIRDLKAKRINNLYGDAVFVLYRQQNANRNGGIMNNAANGKRKIRVKKGLFNQ